MRRRHGPGRSRSGLAGLPAHRIPQCLTDSRIVVVDDQRFFIARRLLQVHRALVAQRGPKTFFSKAPGAMADVTGRLPIVEDHRHAVLVRRELRAQPLDERAEAAFVRIRWHDDEPSLAARNAPPRDDLIPLPAGPARPPFPAASADRARCRDDRRRGPPPASESAGLTLE